MCHFSSAEKAMLNIHSCTQCESNTVHRMLPKCPKNTCVWLQPRVFCVPQHQLTLEGLFFLFEQLWTYHVLSFLSSASLCKRWRAFSCFLSSFRDLDATFRANSLCFSSFSLCKKQPHNAHKNPWDEKHYNDSHLLVSAHGTNYSEPNHSTNLRTSRE